MPPDHPLTFAPLVIGLIAVLVIVVSLWRGKVTASRGKSLRREEGPLRYWFIIGCYAAGAIYCFWIFASLRYPGGGP